MHYGPVKVQRLKLTLKNNCALWSRTWKIVLKKNCTLWYKACTCTWKIISQKELCTMVQGMWNMENVLLTRIVHYDPGHVDCRKMKKIRGKHTISFIRCIYPTWFDLFSRGGGGKLCPRWKYFCSLNIESAPVEKILDMPLTASHGKMTLWLNFLSW